jgi:hypothetical protein
MNLAVGDAAGANVPKSVYATIQIFILWGLESRVFYI